MNAERIRRHVETLWDDSIVPELVEYIRIPNKSPHFDPDWEEHGHMEAAVEHMVRWCEANAPRGMELEVVRLPGGPPSSSSRCRARGTTACSSTATSTSSPR